VSEVLVTGGAGYIGTHVLCALAAAGRRCLSIDNYSNSSPKAIERVLEIAPGSVEAFDVDVRDSAGIRQIITNRKIDSVIHLAALKAVAESVEDPERYYDNNVRGTETLLSALADSPVRKFVFSSSATVYGISGSEPIDESAPLSPKNPYGEFKLAVENMLSGIARADSTWRIANLRYFNPVGAHESGLIGEDPSGIPNNLMPFVCRVAAGRLQELRVFGNDYPTRDGTGVRDYIHVVDLAEGHVAALKSLDRLPGGTTVTANLGTGRGYSVLELVDTFERVNRVRVPRRIVDRRPGDIASYFADPTLAKKLFAWQSHRGLDEMCRDAWRWATMNPDGYR
jgi:UDP-glucose 4-epimerase